MKKIKPPKRFYIVTINTNPSANVCKKEMALMHREGIKRSKAKKDAGDG